MGVGLSLSLEGETVFWSCPVPVEGAVAPVMHISVYGTEEDRYLGRILFQLEILKNSYLTSQNAFITEQSEEPETVGTEAAQNVPGEPGSAVQADTETGN